MLSADALRFSPSPASARFGGRWIAALLVALATCAAVVTPASAQEPTSVQEDILDQLRDDFRVIETRQGWALQPRQDNDDFGLIEIRGGEVLIDGKPVDD
ncbi:MAG: hypothetical protein AAFX50_04305, partial [Acidobacteriota bacterium]